MHAATASPSSVPPRPPRAVPRTSTTPPADGEHAERPRPTGSDAPSASTLIASTITGAVPRAIG